MTWTWAIEGLGTTEQTCHVWNPDGSEVASQTRDAWNWPSDEWPDYVEEVVAEYDFQDAYMGNIERDQSMLA